MKPNKRTLYPDRLGSAEKGAKEPSFRSSERARVIGTATRAVMTADIKNLLEAAERR